MNAAKPWRMDDEQRARFADLADVLIPEAEGMPSASQADVASHWIDVALSFRPDLHAAFLEALERAGGGDRTAVRDLIRDHPAAFEALGTLTAGAYFLNPDVRVLIGYPGQTTAAFTDEVPLYVDLLEHVADRGFIYRPTPATEGQGPRSAE